VPDLRHLTLSASLAIVAAGLVACGAADPADRFIARVGGTGITRAALEHRMRVIAAGRAPAELAAGKRRTLQREALGEMIASGWVIGEAGSRGLDLSTQEVRARLRAKMSAAFPGGEGEFREFLRATGQSLADAAFEARAELAATKLRRAAMEEAPAVTAAQVARYYRRFKRRFAVPESRVARYTNRKSLAAIETVKREVEGGKGLATARQRKAGELSISAGTPAGHRNKLERVIYAATPGSLVGPFRLGADYYLLRVTRVSPPAYRSLARVRATISRGLAGERRQKALARFAHSLAVEWRAKTSCAPGYVVERCKQYSGDGVPHDPLALR
jgi:PPIC-type PPIASE domain/SurA N-terminal domain